MSEVRQDLKYTDSHEWIRQEEDGTVTIGISDYAQKLLGTLVYVEMPEVGAHMTQGEECGVVESVKSASDLYCPLSGEVIEVNEELTRLPEVVNMLPYEDGWILKLKPENEAEINGLMDADTYQHKIEEQAEEAEESEESESESEPE